MIQPYERPAGVHPPLDFPAYKSTQLRAPLRKLVPLPHGLTELTGPVSLGLAGRALGATAGREEDLRRRTPLHVALSGEDHAGSYIFLASDRARGITGTVVHPDGGMGIR